MPGLLDELLALGSGIPLSSRVMNETVIPSENPPNYLRARALLGDRSVMNVVTPIAKDTSMSPANMAMGLIGGPSLRGVLGGIRAYHGSPHKFDKFDLSKATNKQNENAVFFSSSENEAQRFNGPHTYEVALPSEKMTRFRWADYSDDPIYDPSVMQKILLDARKGGSGSAEISGIRNFEHGPKSTTYAVFDDSIIDILKRYGIVGGLTPLVAASQGDWSYAQ